MTATASRAPKERPEKDAASEPIVLVWVQPGHERLAIGQIFRIDRARGEDLRSVGRARYASELEVEGAGDSLQDLAGV